VNPLSVIGKIKIILTTFTDKTRINIRARFMKYEDKNKQIKLI
jgi:hypothetical protein